MSNDEYVENLIENSANVKSASATSDNDSSKSVTLQFLKDRANVSLTNIYAPLAPPLITESETETIATSLTKNLAKYPPCCKDPIETTSASTESLVSTKSYFINNVDYADYNCVKSKEEVDSVLNYPTPKRKTLLPPFPKEIESHFKSSKNKPKRLVNELESTKVVGEDDLKLLLKNDKSGEIEIPSQSNSPSCPSNAPPLSNGNESPAQNPYVTESEESTEENLENEDNFFTFPGTIVLKSSTNFENNINTSEIQMLPSTVIDFPLRPVPSKPKRLLSVDKVEDLNKETLDCKNNSRSILFIEVPGTLDNPELFRTDLDEHPSTVDVHNWQKKTDAPIDSVSKSHIDGANIEKIIRPESSTVVVILDNLDTNASNHTQLDTMGEDDDKLSSVRVHPSNGNIFTRICKKMRSSSDVVDIKENCIAACDIGDLANNFKNSDIKNKLKEEIGLLEVDPCREGHTQPLTNILLSTINNSKLDNTIPGDICQKVHQLENQHSSTECSKKSSCISEGKQSLEVSSVSSTVCRICHTNTPNERLLSPCYCKGSLAYVHLSCLERWLNQSSRSYCELCLYQYNAIETLRYGLCEGIRLWIRHPRNRTHVKADCLIAFLLTLVTVGLVAVCLMGMDYFVIEGIKFGLSKLWTQSLICSFLVVITMGYSVTIYLLAKDQVVPWYNWWKSTVNVRLLLTPSVMQLSRP